MTAFPEKVDPEDILRQIAPAGPTRRPRRRSDGDQAVPWRIVAADGSRSVLPSIFDTDPFADLSYVARPKPQADDLPPLRAVRPSQLADDSLAEDVPQRLAGQRHAGMPSAEPDTEALLEAGEVVRRAAGQSKPKGPPVLDDLSPVPASHLTVGSRGQNDVPNLRASWGRVHDIDSSLARIIDCWQDLPRSVQIAMLAMAEMAREES